MTPIRSMDSPTFPSAPPVCCQVFLWGLAALIAGCAAPEDRFDRSFVSTSLEARTGRGIGTGAAPGEVTIPEGVSLEDGITEDEAIALALWNNADFQEALAELGIKRAELIQAGLLSNPVLSVLLPLGPKQYESAAKLPLEAIWLRSQRIAAAQLDCEQVADLLVESGLDTVYAVKKAFADLEILRQRSAFSAELVALRERIAECFQVRLRAGDVSKLEASASRVNLLKARSEEARLARERVDAEERLTRLLGFGFDRSLLEFETASSQVPEAGSEGEAGKILKAALVARPDLRAAELAVEAAGERAGLARKDCLRIAGILDASKDNRSDGNEVGLGFEIEIPIFDWNQGGRAMADAELERAARHYVTVRNRIVLEVRQAHARFLQLLEELNAWRTLILPSMEEALSQAEKAFQEGEVSLLPVLEGREQLLKGRLHEAMLAADFRISVALLERGVGARLQSELVSAVSDKDGFP